MTLSLLSIILCKNLPDLSCQSPLTCAPISIYYLYQRQVYLVSLFDQRFINCEYFEAGYELKPEQID